jgi:hypothetical protein
MNDKESDGDTRLGKVSEFELKNGEKKDQKIKDQKSELNLSKSGSIPCW